LKMRIMKRIVVALMVIGILAAMVTALAAGSTCCIQVSITDSTKGYVVSDTSSRYLTGASPLAAEVVALIQKNYDELAIFRSSGMKRIMDYGIDAFANADARNWTDYLDRYFEDVNSDLKTLLADKTVTLAALEPRKHYTVSFVNDVHDDCTYGTTYTVTITLYQDGQFDADPRANGLSELLITDEHIAFMQGDSAGAFRPQDHITRAEAAQIYYNLLKDKNVTGTVSFEDVPADAWYATAVNAIAGLNIIEGDGKGAFRPQDEITRAEFVAIGARFAKAVEGKSTFSDLAGAAWAEDEIATAVGYGWVEGYGEGSFKPENSITRAEAATVISRMLEREPDAAYIDANANSLKSFPDVTAGNWYYYTVMEAANGHLHGYTTGGDEIWTELK